LSRKWLVVPSTHAFPDDSRLSSRKLLRRSCRFSSSHAVEYKSSRPRSSSATSASHQLPASMASPLSNVTGLDAVFRYLDKDGDGKISAAELTLCMRTIGEELSLEDAEAFVALVDGDGDGLLGFEEFVKVVEVEGEEERERGLRAAFEMYESEGEGCITPRSLKRTLSRLGTSRCIHECTAMICRLELGGWGCRVKAVHVCNDPRGWPAPGNNYSPCHYEWPSRSHCDSSSSLEQDVIVERGSWVTLQQLEACSRVPTRLIATVTLWIARVIERKPIVVGLWLFPGAGQPRKTSLPCITIRSTTPSSSSNLARQPPPSQAPRIIASWSSTKDLRASSLEASS
ncbi:hypothetical protein GW17_00032196, partial [Ensete ventricosum]